MLKLREELQEQIAYVLIGGILLTAVIPLAITVDTKLLFGCRTLLTGILAGFYLLIAEKKELFFITFGLFAAIVLLQLVMPASELFRILSMLPWFSAALAFGLLAYQHSKEFKAVEVLEGLLAVFLLICASKYIISTEFDIYYAFCLSFIIATLMYNNNMWMRYKDTEKHLLIFLLVLAFADVIQVSAKFISF